MYVDFFSVPILNHTGEHCEEINVRRREVVERTS